MPNRNPSESDPEYQELMAGRSPHKGVIDLSAESPATPIETSTQPESTQPESVQPQLKPSSIFGSQLRGWTTHLFGDRKE